MKEVPTAGTPTIKTPAKSACGPAMRVLTAARKRFVAAYVEQGFRNGKGACERAGLGGTDASRKVSAYNLLRDPRVIAALREEADKLTGALAFRAQSRLAELVESDDEKIALGATAKALEMTGALVKKVEVRHDHTHRIENMTKAELDAAIAKLTAELSPQERLQLGFSGNDNAVDGEFVEVNAVAGESTGQGDVGAGGDPLCAAGG